MHFNLRVLCPLIDALGTSVEKIYALTQQQQKMNGN